MNKDAGAPEGLTFLKLVWKQEDSCEVETDKRIPNLGEKAPVCLEHIGTVLSLLDRWRHAGGCAGKVITGSSTSVEGWPRMPEQYCAF